MTLCIRWYGDFRGRKRNRNERDRQRVGGRDSFLTERLSVNEITRVGNFRKVVFFPVANITQVVISGQRADGVRKGVTVNQLTGGHRHRRIADRDDTSG